MSARFSTSPELRLSAGDSRLRKILLAGFLVCHGCSLWLLVDARCLPLAIAVTLLLALFLPGVFRDPARGTVLSWRDGLWTLERNGVRRELEILPGSCCLPWVVYLPWRDRVDGQRGSLWLFYDGVSGDRLRRLRSRIALEG